MDESVTELATKLFGAIRLRPPGGRWSFFVPGASIGFEFYIDFDRLREAALLAFRVYPSQLAGHGVEDVGDQLRECLLKQLEPTRLTARLFDAMGAGAYNSGTTLQDIASRDQVLAIARAIHAELSLGTPPSLYLRPLWGWRVPEPVLFQALVWVPGTYDLNTLAKQIGDTHGSYVSGLFPPLKRWDGRKMQLGDSDSWIGAHASSNIAADSQLQRIRGALSLAIPVRGSRTFSEAQVQSGEIAMHPDGRLTIKYPEPLVPPLIRRPEITSEVVSLLRDALVACAQHGRLQTSLEYAAAGWDVRGRLGFLHNAIALDALFGEDGRVRSTIREGVIRCAPSLQDASLRSDLLFNIRNELMHGGSASIEGCPAYLEYFERFGVDPAVDQVSILRTCVWEVCRSTALPEQDWLRL